MKNNSILLFCFLLLGLSCRDKAIKNNDTKTQKPVQLVNEITNPTVENSVTPRLFSATTKLYMSWVTKNNDIAKLQTASYDGANWNTPITVATGSNWFNNWADFPTITESNKNILTTYLQKSAPDTYSYDIKINVYNDSLKKWKKNMLLHTDGTKSEHGFVSTTPDKNGGFFVSWLDGRNTIGGGHHNENHHSEGAMSLRTAHISSIGTITKDQQIDNRVCDCCGTSMTNTKNGPLVVYRDRSENEIRDISILRNINGRWSKPKTVFNDNWEIAGCPVNGPAVSSFNNNVAMAWFTGVNEKPKVQLIFSDNSGESFGLPIRIDTNITLGRVDVALINANEAVVTWMEQFEDETLIQLLKVNSNGAKGDVVTLSKTNAERASGFPQIEIFNNKVIAAMTMTEKDKPATIKTVSVDLKNL